MKFHEYEGGIFADIGGFGEVELPANLDTKVEGVSFSRFFEALREITVEELTKDGYCLDVQGNWQEIDEDEQQEQLEIDHALGKI